MVLVSAMRFITGPSWADAAPGRAASAATATTTPSIRFIFLLPSCTDGSKRLPTTIHAEARYRDVHLPQRARRPPSIRQGDQLEILLQPVAQGIVDVGRAGLEPFLVDRLHLPALDE